MAVTPRTSGFYNINVNNMTSFSKLLTMLLMFIGASPASTGGGIKTTTLVILLFMLFSGLKNKERIVLNKRYIGTRAMFKAIAVTIIFCILVIFLTMALLLAEQNNLSLNELGLYTLENLLFETISALCTVGLSCGITPYLGIGGKIIIIIAMFLGKIGPLSIGLLIAKKSKADEKFRYPEAMIMVG